MARKADQVTDTKKPWESDVHLSVITDGKANENYNKFVKDSFRKEKIEDRLDRYEALTLYHKQLLQENEEILIAGQNDLLSMMGFDKNSLNYIRGLDPEKGDFAIWEKKLQAHSYLLYDAVFENSKKWRLRLFDMLTSEKEDVRKLARENYRKTALINWDADESVLVSSGTNLGSGIEIDPKELDEKNGTKIGEGAFSTVMSMIVAGTEVAVKVFKMGRLTFLHQKIDEVRKEIAVLRSLQNENITLLLGVSIDIKPPEDNAPPFLALILEYAEKGSLAHIFQSDKHKRLVFSHERKFKILGQIIEGMKYLHSLKILHLDLKPANILLDKNYNAKISDFGLSLVTKGDDLNTKLPILPGGTPVYMPPEAFVDGHQPSTKNDVYAFSIIVNALLDKTPAHPFPHIVVEKSVVIKNLKIDELIKHVQEGKRPKIQQEVPVMNTLITRCWSPVPSERPEFAEIENDPAFISARTMTIKLEVDSTKFTALFKDASEVTCDEWVSTFHDCFAVQLGTGKAEDVFSKAVFYFLGVKNSELDKVTVSDSRCFLQWVSDVSGEAFTATLKRICQKDWFWGVFKKEDVEQILKAKYNEKTGTWLVAWVYKEEKLDGAWNICHVKKVKKENGTLDKEIVFTPLKYKTFFQLKNLLDSQDRSKNFSHLKIAARCLDNTCLPRRIPNFEITYLRNRGSYQRMDAEFNYISK